MALRTDPVGMNVHDGTAAHRHHLQPDPDGDAAPSGRPVRKGPLRVTAQVTHNRIWAGPLGEGKHPIPTTSVIKQAGIQWKGCQDPLGWPCDARSWVSSTLISPCGIQVWHPSIAELSLCQPYMYIPIGFPRG